jgi:hypothetical protein
MRQRAEGRAQSAVETVAQRSAEGRAQSAVETVIIMLLRSALCPLPSAVCALPSEP